MNARAADTDPGWRPVLKVLPTLMIPFFGMRTMTMQDSGLQATRLLWLVFVNAIVLLWVPVLALGATDGAPVSVGVGVGVTVAVGVGLLVASLRFAPSIDGSSETELARSFQRLTLIRIAFAEAAAIVGFICFLLTGSWVVYGTGFVIALVGMWLAAPRRPVLASLQDDLHTSGSELHLIRVLNTTRLTR